MLKLFRSPFMPLDHPGITASPSFELKSHSSSHAKGVAEEEVGDTTDLDGMSAMSGLAESIDESDDGTNESTQQIIEPGNIPWLTFFDNHDLTKVPVSASFKQYIYKLAVEHYDVFGDHASGKMQIPAFEYHSLLKMARLYRYQAAIRYLQEAVEPLASDFSANEACSAKKSKFQERLEKHFSSPVSLEASSKSDERAKKFASIIESIDRSNYIDPVSKQESDDSFAKLFETFPQKPDFRVIDQHQDSNDVDAEEILSKLS
jgi:hypothetical protein